MKTMKKEPGFGRLHQIKLMLNFFNLCDSRVSHRLISWQVGREEN